MSGGFGSVDDVLHGIAGGAARRTVPDQDQCGRRARRQRSHGARSGRALPRHGHHRALHRVHGCRQSQRLATASASCPRRNCSRASPRAGRCARSSRPTAARSRAATRFDDGGGEVGFISSVTQPFCGDCTRARLSSDGKLYTCLFAAEGADLRAPLRGGASDEELLAADARDLGASRRSLQRTARRAARPRRAARRDESRRRLSTPCMPAAARRAAAPDASGCALAAHHGRCRRQARHASHRRSGGARASARGGGRALRAQRPSHARKARCSTPRSSPASWPPSAPRS